MHDIAGVIIAGGTGRRMGMQKPLAPFLGGHLIDAVIARVRPQVRTLALNVARDQRALFHPYADLELISDRPAPAIGPLGGIEAGLAWAERLDGITWLATFPCDTPFLPRDLVTRLAANCAGDDARPVSLRDGGELHALCTLWPVAARAAVTAGIAARNFRSVRDALAALNARTLEWRDAGAAFFNVNTQEDLAAAEALAKAAPPEGL